MDAYFSYKDVSPDTQNYIKKKRLLNTCKTCNRTVSSRSAHSTVLKDEET